MGPRRGFPNPPRCAGKVGDLARQWVFLGVFLRFEAWLGSWNIVDCISASTGEPHCIPQRAVVIAAGGDKVCGEMILARDQPRRLHAQPIGLLFLFYFPKAYYILVLPHRGFDCPREDT